MSEPTFSVEEALSAQRALRRALGLGQEQFPVAAFVGMISDEIEAMRASGGTDEDVSAIIEETTGKKISARELAEHYAPSKERHHG